MVDVASEQHLSHHSALSSFSVEFGVIEFGHAGVQREKWDVQGSCGKIDLVSSRLYVIWETAYKALVLMLVCFSTAPGVTVGLIE